MDFQLCSGVLRKSSLCFVFFFFINFQRSRQAEKHSLYYIYTGFSKPVDLLGIYEFSAMGLLDDTQIDYYNIKEKTRIPTQHWMKEKMHEDYWERGTQSRKSKEQWFNMNVHILMNRMRHSNDSDVHVLQWRAGCAVEQEGSEFKFSKGISEFSYDGENFLSFDVKESQWIATVDEALPTKRKFDNVPILNQYTKGYLKKECVDWLNKYREYGDKELRKTSPPDVHVFAIRDKTRLKLTCLATGFYPKDMMVVIREYRTSLPEDQIESTGIRPNHDGTFQMRKSVEIKEDERADYDCLVSHRTLKEPIINKWDGTCQDCPSESVLFMIGIVIGVVLVLAVAVLVSVILMKKTITVFRRKNTQEHNEDENPGVSQKKGLPQYSTISTATDQALILTLVIFVNIQHYQYWGSKMADNRISLQLNAEPLHSIIIIFNRGAQRLD